MKQEHIEQIVAATDNLIAQTISEAVAEQFKKKNNKKPSFNYNMIIGVAGLIVLIAGMWFMTNSINNNQNANSMTVISAITPIADGQAGIYDAIDGVKVGVEDIQTNMTQMQEQIDAVTEQNNKVVQKVESLSSLIRNADKNKLAKYQNCLMEQKGNISDAAKACQKHLK
jgi:hypothetical protein